MTKRLNKNEFIENIENIENTVDDLESAIDAATMENFIKTCKKNIFGYNFCFY